MTDRAKSIEAGMQPNYLAEVKHRNKRRYQLLNRHGIQGYFDKCTEYRNDLSDIYFNLTSVKQLKRFYEQMLNNEFPSYHAFHRWMNTNAFGGTHSMLPKTFERCKKVFTAYELYEGL